MAARRLLIVLLVLLGISTLAAALIPQGRLRDETATRSTTQATTTTTASQPPARHLSAQITVGGKKAPVVAGPICPKKDPNAGCTPSIHVGDQLSLRVLSKVNAVLEIPAFGLVGFAAPNSPALFELLVDQAESIGIVFTSTGRVAGRIEVLTVKAAKAEAKRANAKRRARAGSGRA